MKKIILIGLTAASIATFAQTKNTNIHTTTTLGTQSRFEIVQSTLAARWTFRVDKVCGYVHQLVTTANDGLTWESTTIHKLPKCNNDGKIRYQLFMSGISAKHTYLVNTELGMTWQLMTEKESNSTAWYPFDE